MTRRATKRPGAFAKPPHWTNAPPPEPQQPGGAEEGAEEEPDPTRYGDWVKNGIAVDF